MIASTTGNIISALISLSGAVVLLILGGLMSIKTDIAGLKKLFEGLKERINRLEDREDRRRD